MAVAVEKDWAELVALGRDLVERESTDAWEWGEAVCRVEPAGGTGINTGRLNRLEAWVEEIGTNKSISRLRNYARTATAWPGDRRRSPCPYGVYEALASLPHRFTLIRDGMTVAEARALSERYRGSGSNEPRATGTSRGPGRPPKDSRRTQHAAAQREQRQANGGKVQSDLPGHVHLSLTQSTARRQIADVYTRALEWDVASLVAALESMAPHEQEENVRRLEEIESRCAEIRTSVQATRRDGIRRIK